MAGIAQSVQRLVTDWTVRGSNPGGVEIDARVQRRPWVPLSLLHNGYRVFPVGEAAETWRRAGMSNMRPAARIRPFASTPAARTKVTVIWSFNGQNCSFYNLNWINVRRSQKKNSMLFFIQNVFYTWKYDRLFPSVKIFIK